MTLVRIPLVEKASGMTIADVLRRKPQVQTLSGDGVLMLCTHYRRVALCQWLNRLAVADMFVGLANSAWLYAHWLAGNDDAAKRTSRADPFFDAVAAVADAAATAIIAGSRTSWHQGREYEDDFCYARILQLLYVGKDADARVLLERWRIVSGGGESRFAVCEALLSGVPDDLQRPIDDLLEEIHAGVRERQAAESGDPDAAVTTERLSLEGIALIRISHRRKMAITVRHVLVPDLVVTSPAAPLPGPEAWKQVSDPRSLG